MIWSGFFLWKAIKLLRYFNSKNWKCKGYVRAYSGAKYYLFIPISFFKNKKVKLNSIKTVNLKDYFGRN